MAYLGEPVPTVPQPSPCGEHPDPAAPWLFTHDGALAAQPRAGAVLFGRDGTPLQVVSCNGDPRRSPRSADNSRTE
ncbi:hypothetical protein [Kitasatospora brasiliensis]|uniref:hypothetical protein n=1 Tax=Kitasatospora brasiliensis TaxID=3058040 RepID=UPI00292D9264|nr:hypothetical protein [Kitasatospora sp. K002]